MGEERKQPRPGRPKLPPNQVKRHTIAIRTTEDLVSRLRSASKASGRSLAREIEHRLQRSFVEEDVSGRIVEPLTEMKMTLAEVVARINRVATELHRRNAEEIAGLSLAQKVLTEADEAQEEEPGLVQQDRGFLVLLERGDAMAKALLSRVLRHAAFVCGLSTEDDLLDDRMAYAMAGEELAYLREALKPGDSVTETAARHAETQAQKTLLVLGDESPNQPWSRWAASMREALGPAMAQRAVMWRKKFIDAAQAWPPSADEIRDQLDRIDRQLLEIRNDLSNKSK
jgi:hypothetical protein